MLAKQRPAEQADPALRPPPRVPVEQRRRHRRAEGAGSSARRSTRSSAATRACPATQSPGSTCCPRCRSTASAHRDDLRQALDRAVGDSATRRPLGRAWACSSGRRSRSSPRPRRGGRSTCRASRRKLRERYGTDPGSDRSIEARKFGGLPHLGQTFLLARRLIEAGVRLVTVMTGRRIDQAWDTHRDHFGLMKKSLLPAVRPRLLGTARGHARPRPARGHAGGGDGRVRPHAEDRPRSRAARGGQEQRPRPLAVLLHGAVRRRAASRAARCTAPPTRSPPTRATTPSTPEDIAATIYTALGIALDLELHDGQDKPYTLCTGKPIGARWGRPVEGLLGGKHPTGRFRSWRTSSDLNRHPDIAGNSRGCTSRRAVPGDSPPPGRSGSGCRRRCGHRRCRR